VFLGREDEILCKVSADLKLMQIIFLSVTHRILKNKLDATECISFISDLDVSTPFSADYFNELARALLPFLQTDDGTVAARILVESNSESHIYSPHVESFFNASMLQLSTSPRHISCLVPLLDSVFDSACALVDIYGSCLASLSFKSATVHLNVPGYPHHFHHGRSGYKVFVEVQVGSEKPSSHVIYSNIATLPSTLKVSMIMDKQGIFVFVESQPICVISASIDLASFSRFLCSDSMNLKVQHDNAFFGAVPFPNWLLLHLKAKLLQPAVDSSPTFGSSVSTNLADRLSCVMEKLLPVNQSVNWSSILHLAVLSELVYICCCQFFCDMFSL
jgi:hypothetical protein